VNKPNSRPRITGARKPKPVDRFRCECGAILLLPRDGDYRLFGCGSCGRGVPRQLRQPIRPKPNLTAIEQVRTFLGEYEEKACALLRANGLGPNGEPDEKTEWIGALLDKPAAVRRRLYLTLKALARGAAVKQMLNCDNADIVLQALLHGMFANAAHTVEFVRLGRKANRAIQSTAAKRVSKTRQKERRAKVSELWGAGMRSIREICKRTNDTLFERFGHRLGKNGEKIDWCTDETVLLDLAALGLRPRLPKPAPLY
jgi:hypothetical protein